ncbi:MAG: hypothetical protein JO295_05030 [Verrucomicrobia bacterium]|nr:hypothetical protein [Verrucomicrobiota bacterium]
MDAGKLTSTVVEATEPPSIFAWKIGQRSRWNRRLLWLLAFSLCGHVASFYLLQVLYTTPAALPPKAVRITLPIPGSAEGAALAEWLAVADPALAVTAAQRSAAAVMAGLPVRNYTAPISFHDRLAVVGPPPNLTDDPVLSDWSEPTRPFVRLPKLESAVARPQLALPPQTSVIFAKSLQERISPGDAAPRLEMAALAKSPIKPLQPLQPVVFLVGIRAEGGPPLVYQRVTSGVAAADEVARNALAQTPFVPAPSATDAILWGEARVQWGQDAYP